MDRDADFITELGLPFLAHRLRRMSEQFVDGYAAWLTEAGISAPARGLSTLLLLDREGPHSVTEIAGRIRLSHPLIIKLVRQLEGAGLVETTADPTDRRRRPIALTAAGREQAQRVEAASAVISAAYRELFSEIGVDLLSAATKIEAATAKEPFTARLRRLAAKTR
jgi:DNA-binding MarR family transcriptional regulator